jgi:two-component system phosphate regulon sensor histidine kinase PhoR
MSVTRLTRNRSLENIGLPLLALCSVAVIALIPTWLYVGEPFRTAIFFVCGVIAGIAAMFAWHHRSVEGEAVDMHGTTTNADKLLSWTDLASAMPDPAIILDRSSAILNFNASARQLFDRLKPGLPLEHINRDPGLIAAVSGAIANGEKRTTSLAPRGGPGPRLTATVTPVGGSSHEPAAVLITIHDQSEQHRLLEMRSDFIANASHELRTPLASVRGFIETLQGPAKNDPIARERFLAIMADQAERMTRLIDDLLLLSRVEEKANLKPTGSVALNEVIDDVVRSLTAIAAARSITITVEPAPAPLVATGDRDELFQVFHNLIENAVKYGRDHGHVKVSLAKMGKREGREEQAVVTVTDDGPGIAPEHLPRLTERFYRVSDEHSRKVGGTGLGLAIVKHVLNRHDGELSVESVVGKGTTFRVALPVRKNNA